MRVAKRPMPPDIGHYAVTIIVVDLNTGEDRSWNERVPALSMVQAIRRAGMRIIQRIVKKEKENVRG